jgi:chromosome segregation ATPase
MENSDFEHQTYKRRRIQIDSNSNSNSNSSENKLHDINHIVDETSKNVNQLGHMVVSLHNTLNTVCKLLEDIEHRQLQTTLELEKVKRELSDLQTHMMDIRQDDNRHSQNYVVKEGEFNNHGNYIN